MFLKTAKDIKKERIGAQYEERGHELTEDFLNMLNNWHAANEPFDDNLEAYILQCRADILRNPVGRRERGKRYFTPSSANSCPRELYHRLKGDKKDQQDIQPYQGRWQRLGTSFGDMIQRDLLFIHKYYKKKIGETPAFVPQYTKVEINGEERTLPYWEDFVEKTMTIEHGGHKINLMGKPDGVLKYKDGSSVGLEIKTKQTSHSRTSAFSMREPEHSHVQQVVAYSLLYGIDEFIILYGNLSKKGWFMDEGEQEKYPDVRAFYVYITEDDRKELLDRFAHILDAVKKDNPPKIDVDKWTFNRYKTAISKSITDDEISEIEEQLIQVSREVSNISKTKKRVPFPLKKKHEALQSIINFVSEVRGHD